MKARVGAVLMAAALLGPAALQGQDSSAARAGEATHRVGILVEVVAPDEAQTRRYADSLEANLLRSPAVLSVTRSRDAGSLAERSTRAAVPLALAVEVQPSADSVHVTWRIEYTVGLSPAGSGGFTKTAPTEDELASSFWMEMINEIEAFAVALPRDRIILVGEPGARVEGLGEAIDIPASGRIELPLVLPAYIAWSSSVPGAYPERGSRYVAASGSVIAIPRRRWALDIGAYGFSFGELRVSYAISPTFFARATLSQFFLGLSLQQYDASTAYPSLFATYSLLQAGAGLGLYFAKPQNDFRTYAAIDFFARVAMPEARAIFIDPVAPIGVQPCFGLEWGRGPATRLYFELGGVFYPWANSGLMLASIGQNAGANNNGGSGSLTFGGGGWFAEFPVVRLGLRFRL